jgi:hypothetical protein
MNREAIQLEKYLRTLRDRIEHEIETEHRHKCPAIYIIDAALDTVESSTSAETSYDLGLPSTLPSRSWCEDCGSCRK